MSIALVWGVAANALAQAGGSNPRPGLYGIKIDSVGARLGSPVSVPVQITNPTAVGYLSVRLRYDPLAESLHSVTPAVRVAGWEFPPTAVGDTNPGEIHIVGIADTPSPFDTAPPMQPGSGEVAYLNFTIYDEPQFSGVFTPLAFVFNDPSDNVMYDSAGNLIDSSQIEYVNGGIFLFATGVRERQNLPRDFRLSQNYPNPFNPQTRIDFYLPASGRTALVVYDLLGRTVKPLLDEVLPAGPHSVLWEGRNGDGTPAGSGVYFYRLIFGDYHETKKMVLVK